MKVMVTGGAGYIGSVTARALELAGHTPIILDSLLTGPRAFVGNRVFYHGDVADRALLSRIVSDHPDLGCTIHLAARTVVPESVEAPYEYYRDNVSKSLDLFDQLVALGKPRVVFSSSAAVYGSANTLSVDENSPVDPGSPYARTKLVTEQALVDLAAATDLRAISLRYFNPIGADPDLTSGPHLPEPTHVLGQLVMAAMGQLSSFTINGSDYPTRDGTAIRDYVHVWDVARAHIAAVEQLDDVLDAVGSRTTVLNVGSGTGTTVRELVAAFEGVLGRPVPTNEGPRRIGDTVGAFAKIDMARTLLGWAPDLTLNQAISSALSWAERRKAVLGR